MKKIFTILMVYILVFNFHSNIFAGTQDNININAKASILIDGLTGQVIYEQNSNLRLYPASTTKIMTAILAIENGEMDQLMTASRSAVNEIGINGSNVGITTGEILSLEDLLNAMLIKSGNDCANVIAENISPSRDIFISLMNKRAAELGAANTTFTNTCGLDKSDGHPNHMTTVSDMSKIARHAMALPKFREIVAKQKFSMPETNKHPATYWPPDYITTTNKFMLGYNKYKSNDFIYTGIKTGYTNLAGANLISSAKNNDGMELIAVVYGARDQETLYSETKKLFEYGFNLYGMRKVINSGEVVSTVPVVNAAKGENDSAPSLEVVYKDSLATVLPKDLDLSTLVKTVKINENISAPVKQGDLLGTVEIKNGELSLGKIDLIASKDIAEASHVDKLIGKTSNSLVYVKNAFIIAAVIMFLLFGYKYFFKKARYFKKRKNQNPTEN